jgi:DNA-directed RNA polymerase specialized sigma24 family protein
MRLARSHSDAWDLVQDTYERGVARPVQLPAGTNLRLWLMTIMYNLFWIAAAVRRVSRG